MNGGDETVDPDFEVGDEVAARPWLVEEEDGGVRGRVEEEERFLLTSQPKEGEEGRRCDSKSR